MRQPLYISETAITATNAVTTTTTITVPQERGPARLIDFVTENATLTNQNDVTITVLIDGDTSLDAVSLMYYGSNYQKRETATEIYCKPGGIITVRIANASGGDVDVRARITTYPNQQR